jgi:two-component system, LytTR family, sensor histidine kinase AlgZ
MARGWELGRIAAICAAASFFGALVFGGQPVRSSWQLLLRGAAAGAAYSTCCAWLCVVVLPLVVPVLRRRFPPAVAWGLVAVTLVLLAVVGSAVPVAAAVTVGYLPAANAVATWRNPLQYSIYFTLLFGISGTIVAELRSRLDRTSLALRTKERDEAEARRLAIEAQLASLESRVQPHFFFNTLNSIAALVREDPAAAERVVEQLGALMRSSLDAGASPLTPLAQELELVRGYLDIEQIRFGNRLRYRIEVDDAASTTLVPRLSVQTLVENSVKYAVLPRRDGASISIRATRDGGHLRCEIADDGPGFDPAAIPAGHGLALLRARLAMLYEGRASVDIVSRPSATSVVIQVPC